MPTHTKALNAVEFYWAGLMAFLFFFWTALIFMFITISVFGHVQGKVKTGWWGSLLLAAHTVFSEHSLSREGELKLQTKADYLDLGTYFITVTYVRYTLTGG